MNNKKEKCEICGCSDKKPCKGGCTWDKPPLCSQCDDDETYYYDLWEKNRNIQCHYCGGWAIECECENQFDLHDKKIIRNLFATGSKSNGKNGFEL